MSADSQRAAAAPCLPSPSWQLWEQGLGSLYLPDGWRCCEPSKNDYFLWLVANCPPNCTPLKTRENAPKQQGNFHFTTKRVSKFGTDRCGKLVEPWRCSRSSDGCLLSFYDISCRGCHHPHAHLTRFPPLSTVGSTLVLSDFFLPLSSAHQLLFLFPFHPLNPRGDPFPQFPGPRPPDLSPVPSWKDPSLSSFTPPRFCPLYCEWLGGFLHSDSAPLPSFALDKVSWDLLRSLSAVTVLSNMLIIDSVNWGISHFWMPVFCL